MLILSRVYRIKDRLGQGVTLCAGGSCYQNIEYSVPGNIHFGFVARQGGYEPIVIHIGAGDAEVNDPSHSLEESKKIGVDFVPWDGAWGIENGPLGATFNFGDSPQDHQAVQVGIYMYDRFGADMTFSEYSSALATIFPVLARHQPSPNPVKAEIAKFWPYPIGFFDPTK